MQALRQDLAAGGAKKQKEGPKQEGGHILKILNWMYAATRETNVKWGTQISNGGPDTTAPRWRRPCSYVNKHCSAFNASVAAGISQTSGLVQSSLYSYAVLFHSLEYLVILG